MDHHEVNHLIMDIYHPCITTVDDGIQWDKTTERDITAVMTIICRLTSAIFVMEISYIWKCKVYTFTGYPLILMMVYHWECWMNIVETG